MDSFNLMYFNKKIRTVKGGTGLNVKCVLLVHMVGTFDNLYFLYFSFHRMNTAK